MRQLTEQSFYQYLFCVNTYFNSLRDSYRHLMWAMTFKKALKMSTLYFCRQGAECGVGVARRNVTCERSGADSSKESTERCISSTLSESSATTSKTTLLSTISDSLSFAKLLDTSEVDTCFKSCPPGNNVQLWNFQIIS